MKKGVIYARYSSDRQNEQSIAGQVDVCTEWARDNDISIMHVYHDEALTGKTDKRPDFQRMIKDAKNGKFDYIIVYKLDRFARNRYDSAIYKAQLKKYNVRILSAMENIADGPEGIILESVLEGMAEYYSANLAQNVMRGLHQRAELAKYLGGTIPLGYKIDDDKNYVIDENTAFVVKLIYERYADGYTIKEICQELNAAGHKSSTGKKFAYNSLHRLLTNPKYIGRYEYMGVVLEDAIPRIIDDATFEKVQQRVQRNRRAPASAKGAVDFYLTGKLFCGKCGSNMVGDSGTSSTGATHFYYSCIEKKRRHGCTKKTVKKDWIEQLITDITIKQVLTDENIEYVSQKAYELYEKERNDKSEITALNNTLREIQKVIDNIMRAIEQGIITDTTKQRLMEAEERKKAILVSIAKEEIKKPPISQEHIEFFLRDMRNRIYNSDEQIEIIINTFINAVYLYDDKLVLTFNIREGENLKKLELAELEKFGFDDVRFTKNKKDIHKGIFFIFACNIEEIRTLRGQRALRKRLITVFSEVGVRRVLQARLAVVEQGRCEASVLRWLTRKKHFVRSAFFNEAFLFGNIKSLTLMKLPLAMKCAYGTLRNALLHKFAKRIYFIVTKSLLHICRKANASLKQSASIMNMKAS